MIGLHYNNYDISEKNPWNLDELEKEFYFLFIFFKFLWERK